MRRLLGTVAVLITAGIGLAGCFTDIPTAGVRSCPRGGNTCLCEDGTCDAGLECEADGFCRNPRCTEGELNCACGGDCDAGLECIDGSCLLPDDPATSGATVPPPSSEVSGPTTDSTTVATSGMTIDPSMAEVGPGGPGTDPTLDASSTGSGSMESVGEVGEVGSGGEPILACGCGWLVIDKQNQFWECVPDDPMPDPAGSDPTCPTEIDQAVLLDVLGGAPGTCDFGSPEANVRGCCFGGVSVWCNAGALVVTQCSMDLSCFPNAG